MTGPGAGRDLTGVGFLRGLGIVYLIKIIRRRRARRRLNHADGQDAI